MELNPEQVQSTPGGLPHGLHERGSFFGWAQDTLYALWLKGSDEATEFVHGNASVGEDEGWEDVGSYTKRLATNDPVYDTFDYLPLCLWFWVFQECPGTLPGLTLFGEFHVPRCFFDRLRFGVTRECIRRNRSTVARKIG